MMSERSRTPEFSEEAERVANMTPEEHTAWITRLRGIAADPRVRKADREKARARADALEALRPGRKRRRKS